MIAGCKICHDMKNGLIHCNLRPRSLSYSNRPIYFVWATLPTMDLPSLRLAFTQPTIITCSSLCVRILASVIIHYPTMLYEYKRVPLYQVSWNMETLNPIRFETIIISSNEALKLLYFTWSNHEKYVLFVPKSQRHLKLFWIIHLLWQ